MRNYEDIESIIEDIEDHEITCDNEKCIVYGDNAFCYGRERDCELYKQWERKLMRRKR